jgi:flavin-dependent dehydrogenase
LRLRDLQTNIVRAIEADVIILADGRSALAGAKPPPTSDLGIKAHYENVEADPHAITLYNTADCYGGVAPIEASTDFSAGRHAGTVAARWNVAFSVPAARVRDAAGDIGAVFTQLLESNPTMRRHFARAARISDWLASPLPRYAVRDNWTPNVIPIGNAAAAIEPIGGESMGLALRSAELAVEAILDDRVDMLPSQYKDLWRRRSLFCRAGGWIFSRPSFADAAIGLMNLTTMPNAPVLALVGK